MSIWRICQKLYISRRNRDRFSIVDTSIRCRIIDCVIVDSNERQLIFQKIKEKLNLFISTFTIRRIFQHEDFHRRMIISKFFLNDVHLEKRMIFVIKDQHWDKEQWRLVIFIDETIFQNDDNCKRWIIRRAEKKLHRDCVKSKFKKLTFCMIHDFIAYHCKKSLIEWNNQNWKKINFKTYCEHILFVSHIFARYELNVCSLHTEFSRLLKILRKKYSK